MEKLLYDAKIATLGYKCSSFLLALGIFPEHVEPFFSKKSSPLPIYNQKQRYYGRKTKRDEYHQTSIASKRDWAFGKEYCEIPENRQKHGTEVPWHCEKGRLTNFFKKLRSMDLLIIDDFGLKKLKDDIQNDFEQIIDDRYGDKAIVIAGLLPVEDWYNVFQSELIADACMDRLINNKTIKFSLNGESLRKKY